MLEPPTFFPAAKPNAEVEEFDFLAPLRLVRRLSVIAGSVAGLGALILMGVLASSADSSHGANPGGREQAVAAAALPLLAATSGEARQPQDAAAPAAAEAEATPAPALQPARSESARVAFRPRALSPAKRPGVGKPARPRRSILR